MDPQSRESFWSELVKRGDPRLSDHPILLRANWKQLAIPFSVHGDQVPVVKIGKAGSKSFMVISTMSQWAVGSTLWVKQYNFGYFDENLLYKEENAEVSVSEGEMCL